MEDTRNARLRPTPDVRVWGKRTFDDCGMAWQKAILGDHGLLALAPGAVRVEIVCAARGAAASGALILSTYQALQNAQEQQPRRGLPSGVYLNFLGDVS